MRSSSHRCRPAAPRERSRPARRPPPPPPPRAPPPPRRLRRPSRAARAPARRPARPPRRRRRPPRRRLTAPPPPEPPAPRRRSRSTRRSCRRSPSQRERRRPPALRSSRPCGPPPKAGGPGGRRRARDGRRRGAGGPSRCPRSRSCRSSAAPPASPRSRGSSGSSSCAATPPEVASIAPDSVEAGQTVTLAGKHFAGDAAGNTVLFGQARAQVTAASATELEVVVPAGVKARVPVVVQTKGGRSKPVTVTVQATAKVAGLEPDVALPGQVVLVQRRGLRGPGAQRAGRRRRRRPPSRRRPRARGSRSPRCRLPEGSKTSLVLKAGTAAPKAFDLYLGRLPLVTEVTPRRGRGRRPRRPEGARLPARARWRTRSRSPARPALVLSATATELTVDRSPAARGRGRCPELPIVVTVAGRASARHRGLRAGARRRPRASCPASSPRR